MADLLTHMVAAAVPGSWLRDRRTLALLVFGTFLPDLAAKGLFWIARTEENFPAATHSLVGVAVMSYLVALFVEEGGRRAALVALTAGGWIHILVDLVRENEGIGGARPLLPFSAVGLELGWIKAENYVLLLPLDAVLLLVAGLLWRRRRVAR